MNKRIEMKFIDLIFLIIYRFVNLTIYDYIINFYNFNKFINPIKLKITNPIVFK